MMISKSKAEVVQRKGKSKRWRAQMRERAEAEAAARKQARDGRSRERLVLGQDAATRHKERRALFHARYGQIGWFLHALASLTHNCLAHPLMALAPRRRAFDAHERSATRMRVEGWV